MRADRLIATLLLLQARTRVTAREVAEELEVSVRTARRDLEALAMAGVPVYSQAGRGGGWSLIGGARTDLSGLSAPEARALFLVAGPAAATTPELAAALRKLTQALPEPFRREAATSAGAVVIDPARWGRIGRPERPGMLEPLQSALLAGEQVTLGYRTPGKGLSTRRVDPYGLVSKASVWYLIGGTDRGQRTFRVDRVTAVEPAGIPSHRPADFDLDGAWEAIQASFVDVLATVTVRAEAERWTLPILRQLPRTWIGIGFVERDATPPAADDRTDSRTDRDRDRDRDRVSVELAGSSLEGLVAMIAGFGDAVRVTEPPEAKARLATIGSQLTGLYGSVGG